jgi:hypothetical protein
MALFFVEHMKGLNNGLQQETFEKFITQPLDGMIPELLKYLDSIKCNLKILNNFKFGLITHLLGFRKIELIVTKDIVCKLTFN